MATVASRRPRISTPHHAPWKSQDESIRQKVRPWELDNRILQPKFAEEINERRQIPRLCSIDLSPITEGMRAFVMEIRHAVTVCNFASWMRSIRDHFSMIHVVFGKTRDESCVYKLFSYHALGGMSESGVKLLENVVLAIFINISTSFDSERTTRHNNCQLDRTVSTTIKNNFERRCKGVVGWRVWGGYTILFLLYPV